MSFVEHDRMRAVEDYWLYRVLRKEVVRLMHSPVAEAQSDFAPLPPELNAILAGLMRLESSRSSFLPLPFGTLPLVLAPKR